MEIKKLSLFLLILSLCIFSTSVSAAELWSNELWTDPWSTDPAGDIPTDQGTFTWCNSPLWSIDCGSTNESTNSGADWWSTETPTVTEQPKGGSPKTDLWSESFWSDQPIIEKPQEKPAPVNPPVPNPKPITPTPENPKPVTPPPVIPEPIADPPPPVIPEPEQVTAVITMQIGNNKAIVRGIEKELSVPPYIVNGRTMVPLRFIGEAFEATLDWSANESKISMVLEGKSLQLWINQSTALVNGQRVSLDTPPIILNGSALVPLRFISEHLGYKTDYDNITQRITISETKKSEVSPGSGSSQPGVPEPQVPEPDKPKPDLPKPEPIKPEPIKPEPVKPTPPPALNFDYFGMWNLLTDWYTRGIPMGFLVVNEDGSYFLTDGIKNEASGSWRVAEKDEVIGVKEALILENALNGVDWAIMPKQAGLSVRYQHGYSGGAKIWFEYSLGVKINN